MCEYDHSHYMSCSPNHQQYQSHSGPYTLHRPRPLVHPFDLWRLHPTFKPADPTANNQTNNKPYQSEENEGIVHHMSDLVIGQREQPSHDGSEPKEDGITFMRQPSSQCSSGISSCSSDLHNDARCAFCRIVAQMEPAEYLFSNEQFIVIRDIKPVSKYHFLVIPRQHFPNAKHLAAHHVPLVREMASIGRYVLLERMVADMASSCSHSHCRGKKKKLKTSDPPEPYTSPAAAPPRMDDTRMGFHWPPFYSIEHLHLHCVAPASAMGFFNRTVAFRLSWIFVSVDWVLGRLKAEETPTARSQYQPNREEKTEVML